MMTFETYGIRQDATNSIKPVVIVRGIAGYWLHLPEGDRHNDQKQLHCYDTFEKAKQHAEVNVGVR